jgi:coenzyme F420 hydrogenase subunit beta
MKKNNINKILKDNLCNYCATCFSVCPSNAIDLKYNEFGYKIIIDNEKCIQCGLCRRVCSGMTIKNYEKKIENSKENYYFGEYLNIYSGYSRNFNNRYNSSSGGLVTQVITYLLEKQLIEGAVLTKFSTTNPLKPKVYYATTIKDVYKSQGSKYSPVPLNSILKELDFNKKIAIVGLPCHIQGIINYCNELEISHSDILKLGLFCSRTNLLKATHKLFELNKVDVNDISSFKYRGNGHPGKFQIKLKEGSIKYINHLDNTYWSKLFKKYYMPYRCWLCSDKTAYYSDISFADDWMVAFTEDKTGTSLLIVRTKNGQAIINKMLDKNLIAVESKNEEYVVLGQSLNFKMNILMRAKIAKFLRKALPDYKGFKFKEEKCSFLNEFSMFIRIGLINSKLLDFVIDLDFGIQKMIDFIFKMKNILKIIIRRKL